MRHASGAGCRERGPTRIELVRCAAREHRLKLRHEAPLSAQLRIERLHDAVLLLCMPRIADLAHLAKLVLQSRHAQLLSLATLAAAHLRTAEQTRAMLLLVLHHELLLLAQLELQLMGTSLEDLPRARSSARRVLMHASVVAVVHAGVVAFVHVVLAHLHTLTRLLEPLHDKLGGLCASGVHISL